MFSHVMLGTNDPARSKKFYDAALGAMGVAPGALDGNRVMYRTPDGVFILTKPINGEPATAANGATLGFACSTTDQVDAWHAAGVASGGESCEDPPGLRPGPMNFYLAYLRDPDGNKLCALHAKS